MIEDNKREKKNILELIEEMCPDGVEWKRLEDVCTMKNGYTPSRKKPEYWENGTVPWFRMDDIRTNGRELSESLQHVTLQAVKGQLFPADSIIFATTATIGEHALITVPFLCNQRFTVLTVRDEMRESVDIRYLFHYAFIIDEWCRENTRTGTMPAVDMDRFKKFTIPIPPLTVQQEVVRVLDSFTKLTDELTTALKAEEEARKQQYAWYRDEILRLDGVEDVEWKRLEDVTVTLKKETLKKKQLVMDGQYAVVNSGRGYYGRYDRYNNEGNAITIASRGINAGFASYQPDRFWAGGLCYPYCSSDEGRYITKYIFYVLKNAEDSISKLVLTGGIPALNKEDIDGFIIPIPPLSVQRDIVQKLDAFSSYCDDLTSSLPAEIEAREKQYAYYRDRLLSFPSMQ